MKLSAAIIERRQAIREALDLLTEERFISFLRTVQRDNSCTAVRAINCELDRGSSLDEIFFRDRNSGIPPTRQVDLARSILEGRAVNESDYYYEDMNEYGYMLAVKKLDPQKYSVSFGCQAGPTAGDGGEWQVTYGEGSQVLAVSGGRTWVS